MRPLDNVYVRVSGGRLAYPAGNPRCSEEDLRQNPWCGRYSPWLSGETQWTACSDTSVLKRDYNADYQIKTGL